jgi:hypothetical protein
MNYRFVESEQEHAKRLGGYFHQTRQLRRAILYLLTGHYYSELSWRLVALGPGELMRRAAVRLAGEKLVPYGEPLDSLLAEWESNAIFSPVDPVVPQLVRMNALRAGKYHGAAPYPYVNIGGHIGFIKGLEKLVSLAIGAAPDGYSQVANVLNRAGFHTSTRRKWDQDTARTFMQNPLHAGFAVTYKDKLKSGGANKRGGLVLYRLFEAMTEPPMAYNDWLDLNPVMQKREIILVNV